jgi:hypothetical protein
MAVKLNVHANVTGQQQLLRLNAGLKSLGNQSLIAKRKLQALEVGAARAKATMAGLGTALKVGVVAGFAAAGFAAASFVKGTIQAGNLVEKSRIQFNAFFGDVKQGGQAFQILNKYASTVPFTLDKIISGGTALAAISDGPIELGKNLELVGNLAATANISFQDAALQYQRVASAGVAAADLLRDKGVTGLLGFVAGAKYSAEESVKVFEETFLNGGRFSKVAKDLAGTLAGNVSMVEDFYFQIKAAAAKPLFEGLTQQLKDLVGDFRENDEELKALGVRIGQSLAKGFKNLGEFIRLVVDNFDLLVKAIKIFLAVRVLGFIGDMGKAFLLMSANIGKATISMHALGVAFRANPVGIIITALQLGAAAWIYFGDEIKAVVKYIKDKFLAIMNKADIIVRTFWETLGIGNDDNLSELNKAKIAVDGLAASYTKLTKAQKGAFSDVNMDRRTAKTRKFADMPNRRGDMRDAELARIKVSQTKELAEANKDRFRRTSGLETIQEQQDVGSKSQDKGEEDRIKKLADAQNKAWAENRGRIVIDAMEKTAANEAAIEAIKIQRDKLAEVGIESKSIANTISTTWIDGLRQGNSLLEITKNSFKNVLKSIAETLLKKSIEYGVELLFQALLGDKISKEKAITKEKNKQLAATAAMAALNMMTGGTAGAVSNGVKFFGMNKGGVVPGGAPYTDRIPTMLTPGEVVIPRNKADSGSMGGTNITNINISGNLDQRSIDQIKAVISSSSSEVGGANKSYQSNTQGVRGRNK